MRYGLAVVVAVLVLGGLAGLGPGAVPALATTPTCSNTDAVFVQQTWTPGANDAYGLRAPIDFRNNGVACADFGTASSWIGIQQDNSNLTQIGFLHYYDLVLGRDVFCKFWENYPNPPQIYDCNDTNNDAFTFFEIYRYVSGLNAYYAIYDCGSAGGYPSTCGLKNGNQPAYSSPFGVAAAEVHGACDTTMMGTSLDEERYGYTAYPLEGLNVNRWGTRTWNPVQYPTAPSCAVTDYSGRQVADGFRSFDTR